MRRLFMKIRKLIQMMCIGALFILPIYSFANIAISTNEHTVFFGDSLADTGNYPEPFNVNAPSLMNFNLYVPITNPISVTDVNFKNFLTGSLGVPEEQGKINYQEKVKFSANWPLYLTYKLNGKSLITWYQQTKSAGNSDYNNINYAWASAIAGNDKGLIEPTGNCFHDNGTVFTGVCDVDTILQNRNQYLEHTKQDPNFDKNNHYTYSDTQIPDLGKQVSLYLDNGVINNTNLFIYIGANDIGHFLKTKILNVVLEPSFLFKKKLEKQMPLIANHVKEAINRLETAYQKTDGQNASFNIYILTLGHLSNLHQGYSYMHPNIFGRPTWLPIISPRIKKAINNAVDLYNQQLKALVASAHYPNVKILDSGQYLNQLANSDEYKDSIENGTVCVNESAYTTPTAAGTNNCRYKDKEGNIVTYFNWNNSHYTSAVNKQLADYLFSSLNK